MRNLVSFAGGFIIAAGQPSIGVASTCGELAGTWRGTMQHSREGNLPIVITARNDCGYRFQWGTARTEGNFTFPGGRIQYQNLAGSVGSVEIRGTGARRTMHIVQFQGQYRADLQRGR